MSTVKDVESFLFSKAPKELAMSFDNVGLLVGNPSRKVNRILVALDITLDVVHEAIEKHCELIVSHHPVMNCQWNPVQTIREDTREGIILSSLIQSHTAAICMHTNLDAAEEGVNVQLAQSLGLYDVVPLDEDKIVRVGSLKEYLSLEDFMDNVVKSLSCNGLRYRSSKKLCRKVAVGGGSCSDYIGKVLEAGCDTFVTADISYHTFLDFGKINLIDAGHFPTEDLICNEIVRWLQEWNSDLFVEKSERHSDVIQYYKKR